MSGTILDTDASGTVDGGGDSDTVTLAQVEAAQTVDESAEAITTHTGTVNVAFTFAYNGCVLSYQTFQIFIADAGLYAALNSSSTATANITWND